MLIRAFRIIIHPIRILVDCKGLHLAGFMGVTWYVHLLNTGIEGIYRKIHLNVLLNFTKLKLEQMKIRNGLASIENYIYAMLSK